jgi:hypothetical protein
MSKFAMLALNIRHIVILITLASNSSMMPTKEKWTPLMSVVSLVSFPEIAVRLVGRLTLLSRGG